MVLNQLKLQAMGVFNLALPVIILAQFYTMQDSVKLVCSVMIGLYVAYLHYKTAHAHSINLKFEPTGSWKELFEKHIRTCGVDPEKIQLRYGFSNEMIATTTFNTISIDPLLWTLSEHDPKAIEALGVIHQFITPQLSEQQKERLYAIRAILTEPAQRFIIKHEAAHVHYNYSNKKISLMGVIGSIATFSGITITMQLLSYMPGVLAILFGLCTGGLLDLILSQASNYFFKLQEEKKADLFACQYSTQEEIFAAADFFEKFHAITQPAQPINFWTKKIPSSILTGYLVGSERAVYLRSVAITKSSF